MNPAQTPMTKKFITAFPVIGGAIFFLHAAGWADPSSRNWGFHHFGFLNVWTAAAGLLMMASALIPRVQESLLSGLEKVVVAFGALPAWLLRTILISSSIILAWFFWFARQETHLLGDGYLMLRILPTIQSAGDQYFAHNEPLPFFVVWKLWQLIQGLDPTASAETPYVIVSVVCGFLSILISWSVSKAIASSAADRLLIFLFLISNGGMLLFFGHVDNYPLVYIFMLLFLRSSLLYLRGEGALIYPSILYGFLFVSHFGMIVMAPALLVLYYHSFSLNKKSEIAASMASTIITAGVMLWICGYSFSAFAGNLLRNSERFIQASPGGASYAFFTPGHLTNLANIQMLISPFALLMLVAGLLSLRAGRFLKERPVLFLLLTALSGVVFTAIFNFRIGMSRDWNLIAPFMLGLIVAAAYAWNGVEIHAPSKRKLLLMIVVVSTLHTASVISLGADGERSLKRFETLSDPLLWSKESVLAGYEELAIYYRGRMEGEKSLKFYEKYIAIDSSNARIYRSAAYLLGLMENYAKEIIYLEKAAEMGMNDAGMFKRMGEINYGLARHQKSAECFERAIALNGQDPALHLGAALSFAGMKDKTKSKKYLESYLRLKPEASSDPGLQKLIR